MRDWTDQEPDGQGVGVGLQDTVDEGGPVGLVHGVAVLLLLLADVAADGFGGIVDDGVGCTVGTGDGG